MGVVKLENICDFKKGNTGLAKAEPGDYPLVTTGAERKTCHSYQFDTKAALPPLPEQKAIVQKVEKLLVICDQLEAQIIDAGSFAGSVFSNNEAAKTTK